MGRQLQEHAGQKSKEHKHGLQIATYGKMLQLGDTSIDMPKQKISGLTILPIHIEIKNGKLEEATMETPVQVQLSAYEEEVTNYIINEESEKSSAKITEEINNWEQYAKDIGYDIAGHHKNKEVANKKRADAKTIQEQREADKELNKLKEKEVEFKEGLKKHNSDIKRINQLLEESGDLSEKTYEELVELRASLKGRDELASNNFLQDVLYAIGELAKTKQEEFLVTKIANYKPEDIGRPDIGESSIQMKSLSDFGNKYPALQYLSKFFKHKMYDATKQTNSQILKANELLKAIAKEYNEKNKIKAVLGFLNPFADNSKYLKNIVGEKGQYKSLTDKSLTEAERNFLKFLINTKLHYKPFIERSGNALDTYGIIKVDPSFTETITRYGLFQGYIHGLGTNYALRHVKLYYADPKTGVKTMKYYDEISHLVSSQAQEGFISKVKAAYFMTKYSMKAKKLLRSGEKVNEDGSPIKVIDRSQFTYNKNGTITSKFGHLRGKGRTYSQDHHAALVNMIKDMSFVEHMEEVLPLVEGIETFTKVMGGQPNLEKFLDIWKKGNLFREMQKPVFSETADGWLRLFRKWTYLKVMAFNFTLPVFNYTVGKQMQIIQQGTNAIMLKGERRLIAERKKSMNIIEKYDFTSFEVDEEPILNIKHIASWFATGIHRTTETWIQGVSGLAAMSNEQWEWFNKKGEITDSLGKTIDESGANVKQIKEREEKWRDKRIEIKKSIQDVQGKYSKEEWRNYMHNETFKSMGQFKVWLPDAYLTRFRKLDFNEHGEQVEGHVRTVFRIMMSEARKDLLKKSFWQGDSLEKRNMNKNMRDLVSIALLVAAYLAGSDDDDDKTMSGYLSRAVGDAASVYNMNTWEFVFATPSASLGTIASVFNVLEDAVTLAEYKREGIFGDKGDLRLPGTIINAAPYNKIIKQTANLMMD